MVSVFRVQRAISWAVAFMLALGIATTAAAEPPPWARHRGWHGHRGYDEAYVYGNYYREPVVVTPAPVVIEQYDYVPARPAPAFTMQGPAFTNESGQYCREYSAKVNVGGAIRNSYGTACQQPDGAWRMMN